MASHGKNKDYESILFVCVLADLSLAVEAKDLMTDTWCSSWLNLMKMTEQVEARSSTAIIQLTLGQHSQYGTLTSIHVTQHGQPDVNELLHAHKHQQHY